MSARPVCVVVARDAAADLRVLLDGLPALVEDLEVTRSRQSRTGAGGVGVLSRSVDKPVPWDERASAALASLGLVLAEEARRLEPLTGARCWSTSTGGMAAWVGRRVALLEHHGDTGRVLRRLQAVVADCEHVCSGPRLQEYLGTCHEPDAWVVVGDTLTCLPLCPGELYAREGADTVRCRECDARHPVLERKAWLLRMASEQLVTASEATAALSKLGKPLSVKTLRSWRDRGQLLEKGHDRLGRPLFRFGDVQGLLVERDQRAQARAMKREAEQRRLFEARRAG